MGWFPTEREKPDGWKFDIVSLVAVIGESTIERHTQLITASSFSYLPRLIPAPQTLLKTVRPERLPPVKDIEIFGVHSGTKVGELNFFADVIHRIRELKPYEFRKYTIRKKYPVLGITPGQRNATFQGNSGYVDPEESHHSRCHDNEDQALEMAERGTNKTSKKSRNNNRSYTTPSDIVINNPFQIWSLLTLVTTVSVLITAGLFIWAAFIEDGVAMIAIGTVSLSTSISCWANKWHPTLSSRPTNNVVPPGDIVIKTRKGAFVVVHCNEDVTRELYTCADSCRYKFEDGALQWMLGISTVLLMASIIFFSNCGWVMQGAIGIAYIILNMLYWVIPFVMSNEKTWDLSLYQQEHDEEKDRILDEEPSYTKTLWYAIRETGRVDWVQRGGAAPNTGFWGKWLELAMKNIEVENWDAVGEKNRLMEEATREAEEDAARVHARRATTIMNGSGNEH